MRVLIADDHFLFRALLSRCLPEMQVEGAVTVETGDAAKRAIEESVSQKAPYNLVFLDWHMPGCSGFELVERIRDERLYDATPVFMLTAEHDRARIIEVLRAGATGFIMKPISTGNLNRRIQEALQLVKDGFHYTPKKTRPG